MQIWVFWNIWPLKILRDHKTSAGSESDVAINVNCSLSCVGKNLDGR